MDNSNFYTFSEYMKKEDNSLTASTEDYLEMIYRLSLKNGFTRIQELSDALNVQPPSATRMVQRLSELKLLNYEKYGVIMLCESGKKMGMFLLKRHNIIETFLKLIGVKEAEVLEQTEKIEHTISNETLECINNYVKFLKINPDVNEKYKNFVNEIKNK